MSSSLGTQVHSYIHDFYDVQVLITFVESYPTVLDITAWNTDGETLTHTQTNFSKDAFENLKDPDHRIVQEAIERLRR